MPGLALSDGLTLTSWSAAMERLTQIMHLGG